MVKYVPAVIGQIFALKPIPTIQQLLQLVYVQQNVIGLAYASSKCKTCSCVQSLSQSHIIIHNMCFRFNSWVAEAMGVKFLSQGNNSCRKPRPGIEPATL